MGPETHQTNLTLNRHSFLVRIWRETDDARWQGSIEHVRTGESLAFHSLEELSAFVQRWEEDSEQLGDKGLK